MQSKGRYRVCYYSVCRYCSVCHYCSVCQHRVCQYRVCQQRPKMKRKCLCFSLESVALVDCALGISMMCELRARTTKGSELYDPHCSCIWPTHHLLLWCFGALVLWCSGALVLWCSGAGPLCPCRSSLPQRIKGICCRAEGFSTVSTGRPVGCR